MGATQRPSASPHGEPLSGHLPSELSTRYREPSDPLHGEAAAQAQAVKLRAPGLLLGGDRGWNGGYEKREIDILEENL